MEAEQKKLRALESQYNSTRLAVTSSDASVKDMVQLENQLKHVQEQLEQQRKMYEEMEFQHLEVGTTGWDVAYFWNFSYNCYYI